MRMFVGMMLEERAQLLARQHLGQPTFVGWCLDPERGVDFDFAIARQPTEVTRQRCFFARDAAARQLARGQKRHIRTHVGFGYLRGCGNPVA